MQFDKGFGFCILRKQTNESKLESLLKCAQFLRKRSNDWSGDTENWEGIQ